MRIPDAEPPEPKQPAAVHVLGASDLPRARDRAAGARAASNCLSCSEMLKDVFERVGSTLFLDDSPGSSRRRFLRPSATSFTARVLAAYIVLFGRERVPVPV